MNYSQQEKDLLGINQATESILSNFWKDAEPYMDKIMENFYNYILDIPEIEEAMRKAGANIPRLKEAQQNHWALTFTKGFNKDYEERIERIAKAHMHAGIAPHWFVGGYGLIAQEFLNLAQNLYEEDLKTKNATGAVLRAIFLDIGNVFASYYALHTPTIGKKTLPQPEKTSEEGLNVPA